MTTKRFGTATETGQRRGPRGEDLRPDDRRGASLRGARRERGEAGVAMGEAGGEIHRDEVPPIYEQFVQQYFEQIRKASPNPSAPALTRDK